ncbi:MAG: hypothetical protein AAF567_09220 [Actinomycetota bacterium]
MVGDVSSSIPFEQMEQVGKILFGRPLRLRVLLYVLERLDDDAASFYQKEAAQAVDYGASAVTTELDRLIDLGMLARVEVEGSRRLYYQPLGDNPLWNAIRWVRHSMYPKDVQDLIATAHADANHEAIRSKVGSM